MPLFPLLLGMVALLCLVAPTLAAPVVANPSFEINTTEGGSTYQTLYAGFTGLPGWGFSDTPDCVLIGNPDPSYAYATPYGMWQVDLTGSGNTGGGWIGTIVTNLPTGGRYRISFDVGTSTDWLGGSTSAPSLAVLATGNPTQTFSHAPTSVNDRTTCTASFTAPSNGTSTLRFVNTSDDGIGFVAIDNLVAENVPLPTVAMQTTGGTYRIAFVGVLEESTNLLDWATIDNASSPYAMPLVMEKQFFRTRME